MPALLFVLLLLWSPFGAARAAGVELTYDLHAGGFHIGTATAEITVADGRYRVISRVETDGFVGWMTGFLSQAVSEGRMEADEARPAWHSLDNLWRGRMRMVRARFDGPAPQVEVVPPAAEDNRPEVPSEAIVGTVDPLSAALTLAMAASGPPGRVIPVFDGRRRYDLIVTGLAPDTLNEPLHRGPGVRMEVGWRRVAGYAKPPRFMPSNMPDSGSVWLAPPGERSLGLWLPVRVLVDSAFGAGVIRLTGLRPVP